MSSNQSRNAPSTKRIKSIRRMLVSRIIGRKIRICFSHDLTLFVLVICAYLAMAEYVNVGNVDLVNRKHYFECEETEHALHSDSFKDRVEYADEILRYTVLDELTGKIIVQIGFVQFAIRILLTISCLFVVQIAFHWLSYPNENARVKRILSPLDELAKKADEIARFEFSEDKYRIIEETITSIAPDDDEKISLGDEDLLGIENAMNSLIARIRESNRQQARFVNDASHELRTPIAVIQGYANMLTRWGRQDEKVLDESIVAIQHESDNMKRLVEQLLFLARGDAGRIVLNKENVNLNTLMQEVYEESLMIDENHIYKFKCPEEQIIANVDEGLIKQALRILVDNAAKYTNEKDEIILSVGSSEKHRPFLQVQDSGIGMNQADIEHIFERFYRADEARSFNGTGLGLSIAKWIVDKHEGHFEIISREELGTRIGIYL